MQTQELEIVVGVMPAGPTIGWLNRFHMIGVRVVLRVWITPWDALDATVRRLADPPVAGKNVGMQPVLLVYASFRGAAACFAGSLFAWVRDPPSGGARFYCIPILCVVDTRTSLDCSSN